MKEDNFWKKLCLFYFVISMPSVILGVIINNMFLFFLGSIGIILGQICIPCDYLCNLTKIIKEKEK